MRKTLTIVVGLLAIMLSVAFSALGQETVTTSDKAQVEAGVVRATQGQMGVIAQGPETKARTLYWIESEFSFDGKLVKGSPYAAEAVTETTQTLSDGNRIVNRSRTMLYRDSEGRTRREQSVDYLPSLASGRKIETVMINDPVAGVTFSLDPEARTVRKSRIFRYEVNIAQTQKDNDAKMKAEAVKPDPAGGNIGFSIAPSTAGDPGGAVTTFSVKVQDDMKDVVRESLGTQTMEGVEAQGTRVTITIPAGAIGNERPISIVDERWYSPTLQAVVMTRHSDPRTGENIYRLTNIDRSEPSHSLFEVPPDYQAIKEPQVVVAPEVRVKKPE